MLETVLENENDSELDDEINCAELCVLVNGELLDGLLEVIRLGLRADDGVEDGVCAMLLIGAVEGGGSSVLLQLIMAVTVAVAVIVEEYVVL